MLPNPRNKKINNSIRHLLLYIVTFCNLLIPTYAISKNKTKNITKKEYTRNFTRKKFIQISSFKQQNKLIWKKIDNKDNQGNTKKELKWNVIDSETTKDRKDKHNKQTVELDINNEYKPKKDSKLINYGLTVPTAFNLKKGELKIYTDQVFPIKSGEEGGSSNQNYSGYAYYGLQDKAMISLFFSHSDDPLYNKINKRTSQPANLWFNYGSAIKWQYLNSKHYKLAIDSSIESWHVKSGGCNGKGCKTKSGNIFNLDLDPVKNTNIVGSISFPLTWNISEKYDFSISPKITFLPDKQGNKNGSGEFYGTNIGIGLGFSIKNNSRLKTYNSIYIPTTGNNNFDENLNYNKKIIYTAGFNYDLDNRTAFEGYITNRFGSSHSNSILTIPSDNQLLIGSRFIYTPKANINERKKKSNSISKPFLRGLSVTTSSVEGSGKTLIDSNIDNNGSTWINISNGLSNLFDFEVAIGNMNRDSKVSNKIGDYYIETESTNIRVGGKAILFESDNIKSLKSGIKLSFGRSFGETWPGYLFSEVTNTLKVNENLYLNINPKFAWNGDGNQASIGNSLIWTINDWIYIIPESNIAILDAENNFTIAARFIPKQNIYLDLYTTNSYNFTDLGELIQAKKNRFGTKIAYRF